MLEATGHIARHDGLAAVTIDEVARRSGVAKTTVYRHFGSKAELLVAAVDDLIEPPVAPDTGSLVGDVAAFLRSVRPIFLDATIRTLSLEIFAAAARDPELEQLRAAFFGGRMGPLFSVIDRAQARGELGTGLDPVVAIELIEGPLIARSMIAPERLDDLDVDELAPRIAERLAAAAPPR